ncbi:MAG: hypothetical protein SFU25_02085 [Candidatus Caenarcaniphilales bacterium]|nr:hypothetical protein [Candidatus Caenarcaniphilales bacterium]
MFAIGFSQDAQAIRFGLNTGLYKEGIKTSCAHTGEVGLRLGLYFDRSVNDLMYAAAKRGVSLCDIGCGCGGGEPVPVQAPVGCGAPVTPICRSCQAVPPAPISPCQFQQALANQMAAPQFAPMAQPVAQAAPKTEIYLLVLPETRSQQPQQQPVAYYPPQAQAQPYYAPPQQPQYYREPVEYSEEGRPVRGMW